MLPQTLQDLQLPLFEFLAGAFQRMHIKTSSGIVDQGHLFGSVVDVWYSCVLQPWNASLRLTSKDSLKNTMESTGQRRQNYMFALGKSILQDRKVAKTVSFHAEWEPYVAVNYIFFAPLLLKFVRRAFVDFDFRIDDAAHFDMLWEVMRFFMPDHTRPGPLWSAVRKASRVLEPLLRRDVVGADSSHSSLWNEALSEAIREQCQVAFQYGVVHDTLAYDDESEAETYRATDDQLYDMWLRECTWPSMVVDAPRGPPPRRSLRGMVLKLCEGLLTNEATICKVSVAGYREDEQSMGNLATQTTAKVFEIATGRSGLQQRREQFKNTLLRIGRIFNLAPEIEELRQTVKERVKSEALAAAVTKKRTPAAPTSAIGYNSVLPAFLTPRSRRIVSSGAGRVRRRQLRFVGNSIMRPISWYECRCCPCIVRSLVRLSLFLNRKLENVIDTSSGISSEYEATRRLREVREIVEALPPTASPAQRDEQLSAILRSAMIHGEAPVVDYLERSGVKLLHHHRDFERRHGLRINLRFLADIRNWVRALIVIVVIYVFLRLLL